MPISGIHVGVNGGIDPISQFNQQRFFGDFWTIRVVLPKMLVDLQGKQQFTLKLDNSNTAKMWVTSAVKFDTQPRRGAV